MRADCSHIESGVSAWRARFGRPRIQYLGNKPPPRRDSHSGSRLVALDWASGEHSRLTPLLSLPTLASNRHELFPTDEFL
jgi:hypothetical protein